MSVRTTLGGLLLMGGLGVAGFAAYPSPPEAGPATVAPVLTPEQQTAAWLSEHHYDQGYDFQVIFDRESKNDQRHTCQRAQELGYDVIGSAMAESVPQFTRSEAAEFLQVACNK